MKHYSIESLMNLIKGVDKILHVIFGVLLEESVFVYTRVLLQTLGGCCFHPDLPLPFQDFTALINTCPKS